MSQLFRHSGMDRRNPDCMDATNPCPVYGAYIQAIQVRITVFGFS